MRRDRPWRTIEWWIAAAWACPHAEADEKEKIRIYERKPARWFSGVGRSPRRRFNRYESFGRGGTKSERLHEDSGPVHPGDCLRGSDRVLHPLPREIGRKRWTGSQRRPSLASTAWERVIMNVLFLLAGQQSGGQIEKITRTFGVDWSHLISQIMSFCIVCAVLYRWAYRPILKMLEERRGQIAQGLANTEKIKAELAKTETQRQEVMSKANAEANEIIKEAHAAAARVETRETQKAVAAAEQIIVKSREAAAQDYARMLAELKREVGRLVVKTTATVAGKILTAEDQERLAEETAKQLPS
jgi:F-type H+-transporting ATPase subunit b